MHSDSASKDLPGRILLDMDNDTESTALWRKPPRPRPWTPSTLASGTGARQTFIFTDPTARSFQWKEKEGLPSPAGPGLLPSPRRAGRLTLKAEWPVSWRSRLSLHGKESCQKKESKKEFFLKRESKKELPAAESASRVGSLCRCCECRQQPQQIGMKEKPCAEHLFHQMHSLHESPKLPAPWTFHAPVPSREAALPQTRCRIISYDVWAASPPQNHEHRWWPLDPSPQQTRSPCALSDCQNEERNVLCLFVCSFSKPCNCYLIRTEHYSSLMFNLN